jgi:Family of unknown function (DUF6790)
MAIAALRIFIFTLLPLLIAGVVILADKNTTTRERKLEAPLIFLFSIGVAGSGIFNFFSHFFLSEIVAESIGWSSGSPFQLEVAFSNLSLGVLGLIATGRRDGFREATVTAVTIFSVGATIVHLIDIAASGNLAPGNTIQNIGNLLKPVLLIGFLSAIRRAEASPDSETQTPAFNRWRLPLVRGSAPITATIATAYGIGFGIGQPWIMSILGITISLGAVIFILHRSPAYELRSA